MNNRQHQPDSKCTHLAGPGLVEPRDFLMNTCSFVSPLLQALIGNTCGHVSCSLLRPIRRGCSRCAGLSHLLMLSPNVQALLPFGASFLPIKPYPTLPSLSICIIPSIYLQAVLHTHPSPSTPSKHTTYIPFQIPLSLPQPATPKQLDQNTPRLVIVSGGRFANLSRGRSMSVASSQPRRRNVARVFGIGGCCLLFGDER